MEHRSNDCGGQQPESTLIGVAESLGYDSRLAFLQAVAFAAFERLESRVQLEPRALPELHEPGQFAYIRVGIS